MMSKRQQRKQRRRERNALRAAVAERDMWKTMYFARLRELDQARAELAKRPTTLQWSTLGSGLILMPCSTSPKPDKPR